MSFEQLGLSPEIMRAIVDQGYTEPTPIQKQAIPTILEGKDIMGSAQTGTGKTAGFTLPLLKRLQIHANTSVSPARHPIRALILVPTRELAAQVYESVKTYSKYLPLRSAVIYGGINIDPQIKEIRAGVEILVATPGRLLDHIQQRTLSLSKVEILVLDEADRMLDMGFLPDIKRILMLIPTNRQSLMFSATFSNDIKKLADNLLNKPVLIEVARSNKISDLVTHVVHPVSKARKGELIVHLLKIKDLQQVLVFARTKLGTSQLARQLQREGITAAEIHGDKNQTQRTQALEDFKQGVVKVLVATDVAARGLDIEDLPHVINYELPNTPEDYVHRIGRTGRAGTKGDAISLVCDEEKELLKEIEKLIKTKLQIEIIKGFESNKSMQGDSLILKDHGKKDEVTTRQVKKKSNESLAQRQGENRATPRNSRPLYSNSRRNNKPIDPIFTQPYVPAANSVDEHNEAKPTTSIFYGRQKRPIPALLSPLVTDKAKQES